MSLKDKKVEDWLDGNNLSYDIWNKKYRYNNESFDEWLERVSGGNNEIKQLIIDKKFLFGGRILANRGLDKKGVKTTLSNCYVITPPDDSIESIFQAGANMARTFSYGGGVGVDITKLRPKGGLVNNAAKTTSGAVSFMDFYSHITGLVCQEGRRGALMISISCTHPDIIDFINLKTDLEICTKANISIRMSDEFFECVERDDDFYLYWRSDGKELSQTVLSELCSNITNEYNTLYLVEDVDALFYVKKIKAKEILHLLSLRNWEMGEPGILYWDRISNYNVLSNTDFKYAGVNPCAEEPLPAGGSCLLSSLNLSKFVQNSFTDEAFVDEEDLIKSVKISVRALNEVLIEGLPLHPLQEQRESVADWRQIGLGIMGLGDMLIRLQKTYGSQESIVIVDKVLKCVARTAVLESLAMAKEFGCYPKCEKEKLIHSTFISNLDFSDDIKEEITKFGLYNSQLLTIAPTGTLASLLQISSGAEPNFAFKYVRKTISLNNKDTFYEVNVPLVEEYYGKYGNDITLPDYFISAEDVPSMERLDMQSTLQKYIDASISSTLNIKESASVEDVYNIYLNAWKKGLKGCTIWRDNCKRSAILTKSIPNSNNIKLTDNNSEKRPKTLDAKYFPVKIQGENFAVIIGFMNNKPYELFTIRPNKVYNAHDGVIIRQKKCHYIFKSDVVEFDDIIENNITNEEKTITLLVSQLLRHNVAIKHITKTLKKPMTDITHFVSVITRILSQFQEDEVLTDLCPECGEPLVREGGCIGCKNCGYSKCG